MADSLVYWPKETQLFSTTGCKRVANKLDLMEEAMEEIEAETNATKKTHLLSKYRKKKEQFESIFDPDVHAALVKRGERRFTHKALLGALMIVSYWLEYFAPN